MQRADTEARSPAPVSSTCVWFLGRRKRGLTQRAQRGAHEDAEKKRSKRGSFPRDEAYVCLEVGGGGEDFHCVDVNLQFWLRMRVCNVSGAYALWPFVGNNNL